MKYEIFYRLLIFLIISLNILGDTEPGWPQSEILKETLDDRVEHWYHKNINNNEKNWFFQQLENICDTLLPLNTKLPFGKSVAFLIGVSEYKSITSDLPSVKNDLKIMSEFLITDGGFDEIYIARDEIVNRDLVERYMKQKLPNLLTSDDRLLFYYSGHGTDNNGKTGYMQFSKAFPNVFWGIEVLAINDVEDWCREVDIKHLMFIFDCCASGLAFSSKSSKDNFDNLILKTLSGNGSRTVLTAGTADQKSYAIQSRNTHGYGVFTNAFINAFNPNNENFLRSGFITINQIYAHIEGEIAQFSINFQKDLTPKIWRLQENDYPGTFVFLNPHLKNFIFAEQQAKLLNLEIKNKGKIIEEMGVITLSSYLTGDVYLNHEYVGNIERGEVRVYFNKKIGSYHIEIKGKKESVAETTTVQKGDTSYVTILPEPQKIVSTSNSNNKSFKKGHIRFISINYEGKIYLDGEKIGDMKPNQDIIAKDQKEGKHKIEMRDREKSILTEVEVKNNKTNKIVIRKDEQGRISIKEDNFPPMPPQNVRIFTTPSMWLKLK